MSASILRKSLAVCDPDLKEKGKSKKKSKKEKLEARVSKPSTEQVIQSNRNITIKEARERLKAKKEVLEENLSLLKQRKKAFRIKLKEDVTQQIIERAVTRKPVKAKAKDDSEQKTVFTEEDFKKFEEEYYFE